MSETAREAWARIVGTPWSLDKSECRWFMTGWNAGKGFA